MPRHLFPLLTLIGCSAPLPREGSLGEPLDREVERSLRGGSLVAAVVEGGEIVRFAGWGEIAEGGPVPGPETPYRVGSLSKSMTALTLMSLADDGLVTLDAPITDVLPSFRTKSDPERPITARDLLTHQSGLVSDFFVQLVGEDAPSMEQTTARLDAEALAAQPGAMWSYSNVGFNVLGHAVQEVAGVPFAEAVEQRVFAPCGMTGASWDFAAAIQGYGGNEPLDEGDGISTPPAGAGVMSVQDLAGFARIVEGGRCEGGEVVAPATLAGMWTPQDLPASAGDVGQGLGFFLDEDGLLSGGHPIAAHPGDTVLFHTSFLLVQDLGFGVVVMASERDAAELVWELSLGLMREEIEARTGERVPDPTEAPRPGARDHDALAAVEGVYTGEIGVLDLRRAGGGLNAAGPLRLVPTDTGTFRVRPRVAGFRVPSLIDGVEVRFVTEGDQVLIQATANGRFQTVGLRVEAPEALHGWESAAGVWVPEDAGEIGSLGIAELELTVEDGFLHAMATLDALGEALEQPMLLAPVDGTSARIEGLGRYRGGRVELDGARLRVFGATFVRDR